MTREDYERAVNEAMVRLFDELCDEADFPKEIVAPNREELRADLDGVWAQARDSVDWDGLMVALTPEQTAREMMALIRGTVRTMMAAEGLLPN